MQKVPTNSQHLQRETCNYEIHKFIAEVCCCCRYFKGIWKNTRRKWKALSPLDFCRNLRKSRLKQGRRFCSGYWNWWPPGNAKILHHMGRVQNFTQIFLVNKPLIHSYPFKFSVVCHGSHRQNIWQSTTLRSLPIDPFWPPRYVNALWHSWLWCFLERWLTLDLCLGFSQYGLATDKWHILEILQLRRVIV